MVGGCWKQQRIYKHLAFQGVIDTMVQQQVPSQAVTAERAAALFRAYDVQGRGWLDRTQMVSAMAELGMASGMPDAAIGEVLSQDTNMSREHQYSLQDFLIVFGRIGSWQVGPPGHPQGHGTWVTLACRSQMLVIIIEFKGAACSLGSSACAQTSKPATHCTMPTLHIPSATEHRPAHHARSASGPCQRYQSPLQAQSAPLPCGLCSMPTHAMLRGHPTCWCHRCVQM